MVVSPFDDSTSVISVEEFVEALGSYATVVVGRDVSETPSVDVDVSSTVVVCASVVAAALFVVVGRASLTVTVLYAIDVMS